MLWALESFVKVEEEKTALIDFKSPQQVIYFLFKSVWNIYVKINDVLDKFLHNSFIFCEPYTV